MNVTFFALIEDNGGMAKNGLSNIGQFIDRLLVEEGIDRTVDQAESLFLSGLLTSLSLVKVVMYLEENYNFSYSTLNNGVAEMDTKERLNQLIEAL